MSSKWFNVKNEAVSLRKNGVSIKKIEKQLGIPRSTLSGWFRNIELSEEQRERLHRDWQKGLIKARKRAVAWHKSQKKQRVRQAEEGARTALKSLDLANTAILELGLAMLYLGEGSKKTIGTSLGSSDPLILKFFLTALRKVYGIPISRIRCELYLRADQNLIATKRFWSKELNLPLENFSYVSYDKRTDGSKTYPDYKGVCSIRCGRPEIQRKLMFLSRLFSTKVVSSYLGS